MSMELTQTRTRRTPLEWMREHQVSLLAVTGLLAIKGFMANEKSNTAEARTLQPAPSTALGIYTKATPEVPAVASSTGSQAELNAAGTELVNAMPGFYVDFKQPTLGIEPVGDTLVANYECPTPNSPKRAEIQSIQVMPGNRANVTFCDSEEAVKVSTPNMNSATNQGFLNQLLSDPLRNRPWGLDEYQKRSNVYYECGDLADYLRPELGVKYVKGDADNENYLAVGFDVADITPYCGTELGQVTDIIDSRIWSPKKDKWIKVGRTVLVVETTKGAIGDQIEGAPNSIVRERVRINELGKVCKPGKTIKVKARRQVRFTPNDKQQKVHDSKGGVTPLKPSSHMYKRIKAVKCPS